MPLWHDLARAYLTSSTSFELLFPTAPSQPTFTTPSTFSHSSHPYPATLTPFSPSKVSSLLPPTLHQTNSWSSLRAQPKATSLGLPSLTPKSISSSPLCSLAELFPSPSYHGELFSWIICNNILLQVSFSLLVYKLHKQQGLGRYRSLPYPNA